MALSAAIAMTALTQWGSCRFYTLPMVWPWYVKYAETEQGAKIDITPFGCNDVDNRTIAVLMGVLTTLISLSRNAE
jgi:hypothetical protein